MFLGLAIGNYILVFFYATIAFRKDWGEIANMINKKMTTDDSITSSVLESCPRTALIDP